MNADQNVGSKLVLLVSDDPHLREQALGSFPSDVEVSLATASRDALDAMEERTPDVVVVDIQTGNAGGFDLARAMSQTPRLARIPVLILIERMQDSWLARQAGASAYARKPLDAEQLARKALSLLSEAAKTP